jgi:hypothetical protein
MNSFASVTCHYCKCQKKKKKIADAKSVFLLLLSQHVPAGAGILCDKSATFSTAKKKDSTAPENVPPTASPKL